MHTTTRRATNIYLLGQPSVTRACAPWLVVLGCRRPRVPVCRGKSAWQDDCSGLEYRFCADPGGSHRHRCLLCQPGRPSRPGALDPCRSQPPRVIRDGREAEPELPRFDRRSDPRNIGGDVAEVVRSHRGVSDAARSEHEPVLRLLVTARRAAGVSITLQMPALYTLAALVLAPDARFFPFPPNSPWEFLAPAAEIVAALILRSMARARWQQIDWMICKPARHPFRLLGPAR